jgi:tetraprenyl-beta-curcumene synthase
MSLGEMSIATDSLFARQALTALITANARYWSSVTPIVRRQLRHWRRRAEAIEDPQLRKLALAKLRHEAFNAEVAAVAATLAPRPHRAPAVQAIVALELLYDYLDGLTERSHDDPLAEGERLYSAFTSAVDLRGLTAEQERALEGHVYLCELADTVRSALTELPASEAIGETARRCAERAAQAQVRMHAAPLLGTAQLADWARAQEDSQALAWREYVAGAASSVLALHALIAAAADPRTTREQAERLDAAYLSIAAVVTLLDGLIDHARDREAGELSYASLYDDPCLLAQALSDTARLASTRAMELPGGAHHLMTLAGAIAYWSSAPGAGNDFARPLLADLRSELRGLVLPPLLVMRAWRVGKWTRRRWRAIAFSGRR